MKVDTSFNLTLILSKTDVCHSCLPRTDLAEMDRRNLLLGFINYCITLLETGCFLRKFPFYFTLRHPPVF